MSSADGSPGVESKAAGGPAAASTKRGARACVSCRRGKNRCVNDGAPPCVRCKGNGNGASCVFETPSHPKHFDEERVERMEKTLQDLSSTVSNLATLLSRGAAPVSDPSPPPRFDNPPSYPPSLLSIASTSTATPPLRQTALGPATGEGGPLRLDADFNAHSPSNPMTWEIDPSSSSLNTVLSHPHVYQNVHLPPTIPTPPTLPGLHPSFSSHNGHHGAAGKRPRGGVDSPPPASTNGRVFPPLPNYRAPPHPISMYGLIPSTAASSDDEDALPTASLTAPFEALAQAAAEASGELNPHGIPTSGSVTPHPKGRPRKRRKPVPPPPNAFPDVVDRGLVTDTLCRELYQFFLANCLPFFPILDEKYDTYEALRERTPWSINSIVAVAAIRYPNASVEVREAAEYGSEEAHGIARSSLFGPTVRMEGCQAMGLLAAFSQNGYLAAGHALRMALELNLPRALARIAEDARDGRVRSQTEQQSLVVSARIFLCMYWLDHVLSSSSGRPNLGHEELVSPDKLECLLKHPLSIESDKILVANFELLAWRSRIEARGDVPGSKLDSHTVDFTRRSMGDLQRWYTKWDTVLAEKLDAEAFDRKRLVFALNNSSIFLVMNVLKNQSFVDTANLSSDARELALSARQSAGAVLDLCDAPSFRALIRYATQDVFVDLSFACLLYLKLSRLFPQGVDIPAVLKQANDLQLFLSSECPGVQRFVLTLKIAVERFGKAFKLEVPVAPTLEASYPDTLLNPPQQLGGNFPFAGFDITSLPMSALPIDDSAWVGVELYPEWLRGDAGETQDWSFDTAWSDGIDRLFLPQWSTGMNDATEW